MTYLIVTAVVVLLPIVVLAALSAVATRPTNLGVRNGRLAPCPSSPNCVSTQAEDDQHRTEPIPFSESRQKVMQRLRSVLATMPRMTIVAEADGYLHVEATSLIFRFVDDVEFFVDEDGKVIQFRSASRAGHSDFGANRRRMEEIREAFERAE
jgi:uncharacterized protein (DUF1499 family)